MRQLWDMVLNITLWWESCGLLAELFVFDQELFESRAVFACQVQLVCLTRLD